ncbi:MAG: xanthine dehydrogenase family protein molybdopterin-binding subunit, partial [Desulfobacterota bacterium]|nr:xanthine dehydrogenase family protein molybdopterin-binding subunit [Thermodesulfobacteriota bacterium]
MIARERRILSGRGLFIDNMELPLMAHCVFVGSPHAHARIRNIDCESALRTPGVLTVITGEEMVKKTNPLPPNADFARKGWTWRSPTVYPLAVGKARFHGEPVAAVIADHPAAAIEAAHRLGVEYEPLPHVLDATEAMKKGAPLLYEDWGDNIQMQGTFNYGRVDQAFAEADRTVTVVWREARCSGFPIEARGCLAAYDPLSQTLNAWGTYQCPFRAQYGISHVLRVPLNQVRVVASDIGGAFGNKINSWKSSVVCFAAMKIQRPVKWIESTREFILSGPHQRDVFWDGEAAFQKDGRILGVKARFIQDLGVEVSHRDFAGPSIHAACASVPNAYRLKGVRIDALGVVTNKSHYGAYRGYGKDKGIKFMERIMDRVAQECRVDPAEIRRLNFIRAEEFPYRQISGLVYDSGNYIALLDRAVQLAEVDKWRKLQEEGRQRGRCIGVGIAFVVEPAGVAAPNERYSGMVQARIRLTPDGLVEVYSDRTEIGQGAERSNAIAVAEILGCKLDDVVVKPVTSDMAGMGPVSSRGSVHCLSAIARAAKEIRSMIVACAAAFLDEEPGHLELKEGVVFSTRSPDRR